MMHPNEGPKHGVGSVSLKIVRESESILDVAAKKSLENFKTMTADKRSKKIDSNLGFVQKRTVLDKGTKESTTVNVNMHAEYYDSGCVMF